MSICLEAVECWISCVHSSPPQNTYDSSLDRYFIQVTSDTPFLISISLVGKFLHLSSLLL